MNDRFLEMWTVYWSPLDYPGQFVARKCLIGGAPELQMTNDMYTAATLEELRDLLPPGLVLMPRDESDDPVIVETWI